MKNEVCNVEEINNGFLVYWQEPVKRPPSTCAIVDTQIYGTPSFNLRPYLLKGRTVFCDSLKQLQVEVAAAVEARKEISRLQKEGLLDGEDAAPAAAPKVEKKAGGKASP
jgi:hypothetical protein